MMDIRSRIAEVAKKHARHAPSLVPKATPKRVAPEPVDEELIPTLDDLGLPQVQRDNVEALVARHLELGEQERAARKEKDLLSAQIKALCAKLGADKLRVGEARVAYYNVPRSSIKVNLLLEHGILPSVIAACTKTTDNWTLRISRAGEADDSGT